MRLARLELLAVGHWSNLALELSPRLSVILGDNEAGKTTLRRALHALLFGVRDELTAPLTRGRFHMRARVGTATGEATLERQGQRDPEGLPQELSRLLVPEHRQRFAELFWLSHETIVPPPDSRPFAPEGLIASLLFGARAGVSPLQLRNASAAIEQRAKRSAPGTAQRNPFRLAGERYARATAAHERIARFAGRDEAREAAAAVARRIDALEVELRSTEAETERLGRILDAAGELGKLRAATIERQALLAEGSAPAPARVAALGQLGKQLDTLATALGERENELAEARSALAAAPAPGRLHELAPLRDAAREAAVKADGESSNVAELERQAGTIRGEIADLVRRLGLAADTSDEARAALLCPEPEALLLEGLLAERQALAGRRQLAEQQVGESVRELDECAQHDPAEALPDPAVLETALEHVHRAREAELTLEQLGKAQAGSAASLARHARQLGLSADTRDPHSLALPARAVAEATEAAFAQAQGEHDALRKACAAQRSAADELGRALAARRDALGAFPSLAQLASARGLRDAELAGLAARCEPDPPAPVEPSVFAAGLQRLGRLSEQADLLADQRLAAGERLGELQEAERGLERARAELGAAEASLAGAGADLERRRADHAALWPFLAAPPAHAGAWFDAWELWRREHEEHARRAEAIAAAEGERERAMRDACAAADAQDAMLAGFASAAALGRELERRRGLAMHQVVQRAEQAKARLRHERSLRELAGVEEAETRWRERWAAAATQLPPSLGNDPAAIERWLKLQAELRRAQSELGRTLVRGGERVRALAEQRRALAEFVAAARELDPALGLPVAAEERTAFAIVDAAIAASMAREAERRTLERRVETATTECERARTERDRVAALFAAEWEACAGAAPYDPDAFEALAVRAAAAAELERRIEGLGHLLAGRWGEELAENGARLEREGEAVLAGRRSAGIARIGELQLELEATRERQRELARLLAGQDEAQDATTVVQELADARETLFAAAREWLRAQVAETILSGLQQEAGRGWQTLEELAGSYFHSLTEGAWRGLRIDETASGSPELLAVDAQYGEKTLGQLSAGTRDQLWLALRLAAVVAAARETPFPLLLDDTLVQFDDRRARAALGLLHEISAEVQVILFTHHDQVAALAEEVIPAQDLAIVTLPEVNEAMRARQRAKSVARRPRPIAQESPQAVPGDAAEASDDAARSAPMAAGPAALILAILEGAGAALGKGEVLALAKARGHDIERDWGKAIGDLVARGEVVQQGHKRWARYTLAVDRRSTEPDADTAD